MKLSVMSSRCNNDNFNCQIFNKSTFHQYLQLYGNLFFLCTGVISTQGRLWKETVTDDSATEGDCRRGGQIPSDIHPKLMHEIQVLVSRFVAKAQQLLGNQTTNLVECWMYIRCKFNEGKVINRSQSGFWEDCCMGAGLQHNLGKEWGPSVWSSMISSLANQDFIDTARSSANKADKYQKRKATDNAKERRRSKYSRNDDTLAARKS